MKATIVTTTIYVPYFLEEYSLAADRNQHDIDFIVVGDKKTDRKAEHFCETIPNCTYLSPADQEEFLGATDLSRHLPYNSVERRNVGMLMAYKQHNSNTIITLDDDNYTTMHDAIKGHTIVGRTQPIQTIGSSSGWYNVCNLLKEKNGVEFYHRGYPPAYRFKDGATLQEMQTRRVMVNAGLWTDNPDVDAITRLERELVVTGFRTEADRIALAPGTWSPFNCQNTALHHSIIPAYFLSPAAGRHADIFASYVVNKLTEHFGDVIAFGYPLARHTRSPHDLWKDLEAERPAIQTTDLFCALLRDIRLNANSYHEGFGQIARSLAQVDNPIIQNVAVGMLLWHETFEELETRQWA